jgi:hypothetical protein
MQGCARWLCFSVTGCSICLPGNGKIARNSVLVSGFPDAFKRKWLGPNYHISSNLLWANDPHR